MVGLVGSDLGVPSPPTGTISSLNASATFASGFFDGSSGFVVSTTVIGGSAFAGACGFAGCVFSGCAGCCCCVGVGFCGPPILTISTGGCLGVSSSLVMTGCCGVTSAGGWTCVIGGCTCAP